MKRSLLSLCAVMVLVVVAFGCSSSTRKGGYWGDRHTEELASYDEIPQVDFNIAGTIDCKPCLSGDLGVVGFLVEVVVKGDPLNMLATRTYVGIEPFNITELRYRPGATLTLYCYILSGDEGEYVFSRQIDITVPDDDGETVAVTVNF